MSNFLGNVHWQGIVVGVVVGIVLAPQIARLPFVGKIPTA